MRDRSANFHRSNALPDPLVDGQHTRFPHTPPIQSQTLLHSIEHYLRMTHLAFTDHCSGEILACYSSESSEASQPIHFGTSWLLLLTI